MPVPAAAAAALKSFGKRLLVQVAAASASKDEGPHPVAVALACLAAIAVVGVWAIVSAPLALWDMASGYFEGGPEGTAVYGQLEDLPDEQMVKWYVTRADELEAYARGRWNSGTGEDVYSTPDWRYLCALDMAAAENDFDLIKENAGYYDGIHRALLTSRSSVKYRYVYADEGAEGAVYSEEDGRWYVIEPYTIWSVSYRPLASAFKGRGAQGVLSDEFKYFGQSECGEYGVGWGDQGNALGFYQFDRRYSLGPFVGWLVAQDPAKWSMLAPWADASYISQGDSALEAAWIAAYNADPEAFASGQDRFFVQEKYAPAEDFLRVERGVDISGRRDCVKGLVAGVYNLFGSGGWRKMTYGLSDAMSDEEFARAIVANVIGSTSGYQYGQAYRARYESELQTVLSLLAAPTVGGDGGGQAAYLGSDPSAEGSLFGLDTKGMLADNYRRALLAVDVTPGPFGGLQVEYDHARFVEAVTSATIDGKRASTGNQDVVNAALSKLGSPYVWAAAGPDCFDCSGLVTWAYAQIGVNVPHYTGDQYAMGTVVDEADAEPGDLVMQLFGAGTNAVPGVPGHVGIYIGDGQMVHAPTFGAVVRVDDVRVFDPSPVFVRL